jgi:hypothetical protein
MHHEIVGHRNVFRDGAIRENDHVLVAELPGFRSQNRSGTFHDSEVTSRIRLRDRCQGRAASKSRCLGDANHGHSDDANHATGTVTVGTIQLLTEISRSCAGQYPQLDSRD